MNIDLAVIRICRDAREQGIEIDPIGLRANLESKETMDYNKAARFCLWTGAGLGVIFFAAALFYGYQGKHGESRADVAFPQGASSVHVEIGEADLRPVSVDIGDAVLNTPPAAHVAPRHTIKAHPVSSCQTGEWRALRGSPTLSTKKASEASTGQSVRVFCP